MEKNQRIMFAIAVSCTIAGGLIASVLAPPEPALDSGDQAQNAHPSGTALPPPSSAPARPDPAPEVTHLPAPAISDLPDRSKIPPMVRPTIPAMAPVRSEAGKDATLDHAKRRSPQRLSVPDAGAAAEPISVEIKIPKAPEAEAPEHPVVPKPTYVRFLLAPDQTAANGFLGHDNRIEIAEAVAPTPEQYRIQDIRSDAHLLLDFPGFCGVIAHAKSEDDEIVWMPRHVFPDVSELQPFSRVAGDPAAMRLLDDGKIDLKEPEGWSTQTWLVCSDETVDGLPPFSGAQALAWMSGVALGEGTSLTKGRTDG